MLTIKLSTLQVILEQVATINQLRPCTGNVKVIRRSLAHSYTDHQLGMLFRAIDQLCLTAKLLQCESEIPVIDDRG